MNKKLKLLSPLSSGVECATDLLIRLIRIDKPSEAMNVGSYHA